MIDQILRILLVRRKPTLKSGNENLLNNYALELAQEWGKYWLKPIQERMGKAYPQLSIDELNRYNEIAQETMKYSHDLVYSTTNEQGKKISKLEWKKNILSRYPWVDSRNLSHLFSTGMYYAWKDGIGH